MSCAVCLDGSPPAYHFDQGFGKGVNNWIVHIEVPFGKLTSIISVYWLVKKIPFCAFFLLEFNYYAHDSVKNFYVDTQSYLIMLHGEISKSFYTVSA